MKRSFLWAIGLALALGFLGASVARAADSPDLRTIGIDVFPQVGQNQPSSIGDFAGKVGYALLASDSVPGFKHFEADMRFEAGIARDPRTGFSRRGVWGLT
jgi:hypothetical protein